MIDTVTRGVCVSGDDHGDQREGYVSVVMTMVTRGVCVSGDDHGDQRGLSVVMTMVTRGVCVSGDDHGDQREGSLSVVMTMVTRGVSVSGDDIVTRGVCVSVLSRTVLTIAVSGGDHGDQRGLCQCVVTYSTYNSVSPKARKAKLLEYNYTGNIYILPVRAMNEYLLKPGDLEGLPKYERRSPYESGPKITVFLRTDVETIAQQVWGGLENLAKEKNRISKRISNKKYDLFQIRALLDQHQTHSTSGISDDRPYLLGEEPKALTQQKQFWASGSARVVMSAIFVNGLNSVMKLIAWLYTGSHSMFSEFIHSVADTMNQIILGVGLYHSIKKPDPDHPYGYSNLRHISSLISGVGIFFFGTGLSFYHGFQGFMHPEPLTSLNWGIATLVGAFVSEGATLIIAINQVRKSSRAMGIDFWQYVRQGVDPSVSVVLLEDMAAVVGVGVAGVCMTLTQYVGSTLPDALGSCAIGSILGLVASYVIYTNTSTLVGKSIPFPVRQGISEELEGDRMIR
ncbi:hypothetical protein ACOMHN_028279 [Nucella lapillus]